MKSDGQGTTKHGTEGKAMTPARKMRRKNSAALQHQCPRMHSDPVDKTLARRPRVDADRGRTSGIARSRPWWCGRVLGLQRCGLAIAWGNGSCVKPAWTIWRVQRSGLHSGELGNAPLPPPWKASGVERPVLPFWGFHELLRPADGLAISGFDRRATATTWHIK